MRLKEVRKALEMPDVKKTLTETLDMDIAASSPEAAQKFIATEMQRWERVVNDNNIKAN